MDERHAMAAWLIERLEELVLDVLREAQANGQGPVRLRDIAERSGLVLSAGEVSNTNDWIVAGVLSQLMVKGLVRRPRRGQYEIV